MPEPEATSLHQLQPGLAGPTRTPKAESRATPRPSPSLPPTLQLAAPSDALYANLWGMQGGAGASNAEAGWDTITDCSSVYVGIW